MTQHPDTPTSQFTAVRWTFYRRLGLLMRTRLLPDGTTLSLHELADRTEGYISADELAVFLAKGAQARPDAVLCVKLAQALDVDPDYFVSDEALSDYVRSLNTAYAGIATLDRENGTSLQSKAMALVASREAELAGVSSR